MWKPLSWEGTRGELNLPCRWEGRVLPGWWLLRVPWNHTVQDQDSPGARGKEGSSGLEVQGGRCREGGGGEKHLYLSSTTCSCPGLRLPVLGLIENMQLSCTRMWCSSVLSNSVCSAHSSRSICRSLGKRKALGGGYKTGGVKPLTQNREAGALSPRREVGSLLHPSLLHPTWQAVPCMAGQTWLL